MRGKGRAKDTLKSRGKSQLGAMSVTGAMCNQKGRRYLFVTLEFKK